MNTLHFKYAVEVEKTGSITLAAENLYMAQPNLSKAIKELEENLGYSVFERSPRGVIPTKKGAEFLVYAKNILDQIDKMDRLARPEDDRVQHFAVSIPRGSYIAEGFTKFVSELDMEKGIDVNIQETGSMQTIADILEGRFRMGIIRYQTNHEEYFLNYLKEKGLAYDTIWEFDYLVVLSREHPLAEAAEVTNEALRRYIEIVHGDTTVPYLSSGDVRGQSARERRKIYVYERSIQFDLLHNIPTTFMWVSPIPEHFIEKYGLIQRRCVASNRRCKDVLVYPKGYALSELDRRFVDKIYEAKNEVSFREYR